MIWLSSSTIARLRDQLRAGGERPSVTLASSEAPDPAEWKAIVEEYMPICEAMYLMMSADGTIAKQERDVLAGALRSLSGDEMRTVQIDALLDAAAKSSAEQGRNARLRDVAAVLRGDPARAEVAFVLSAAVAFADNAIADEENEALGALAQALGIDDEQAEALLNEVERDRTRRPRTTAPPRGA